MDLIEPSNPYEPVQVEEGPLQPTAQRTGLPRAFVLVGLFCAAVVSGATLALILMFAL